MVTAVEAKRELDKRHARRELARRHLLYEDPAGVPHGFLLHFPPPGESPFVVDTPQRIIAQELTNATHAVERGECYYALIFCPPRHWKSSIVCKRYPAWHLGRNPDHEIIMASYGASLVHAHSRELRRTVESDEYARTFSDDEGEPLRLSHESRAVDTWQLSHHYGKVNATGFDGSITGKGAHVLIIDDAHKGWVEAQSAANREHVWQVFTNDLMSRRAPAHAVVIVMTRWHRDDLWGRIVQAMHDEPDFPRFKQVILGTHGPGRVIEPDGEKTQIEYDYLFPKRFGTPDDPTAERYYRRARATCRNPAAAPAMFDGTPIAEGGNRFKVNMIDRCKPSDVPEGLRWCRYWDLASTDAERTGSNPAYTAGALGAVSTDEDGAPHVWVRGVVRARLEAPERDELIVRTARADGMGVEVVLETVAGYIDTAARLERDVRMKGFVAIARDAKPVSKEIRAQNLEPVMAVAHVHVIVSGEEAAWLSPFLAELSDFPASAHKDQVDALTGLFAHLWNPDDWLIG